MFIVFFLEEQLLIYSLRYYWKEEAFDYVNSEILLLKLYYYGIRGNIASLFASYPNNRQVY